MVRWHVMNFRNVSRAVLALFVVSSALVVRAATELTQRAELFSGAFAPMISPAPEGAAEPRLTVDASGRVYLSWLEPLGGGGSSFRFSALGSSQWGTPKTIAAGPTLLANSADFPALFITRDGMMAAHWLERGQGRASYGIKLRTSRDEGRTWTDAVTPHRDGTASEHGFVSFFEAPGTGPGAGLGLVWLDGREMANPATSAEMTLRSAMVSATGEPGEELVVDGRVCDCCQTSAATTDAGVVVAYRDRSEHEIRDIYVTRLEDGRWSTGAPVYADNWEINGCPVNGPAIAARGQSVAVAWFVGVNDTPKTQLAFSTDGGRTFGAPVRIDSGTTLGRVGVALLADGRALVSWIDDVGAEARFMVRVVVPNGTLGSPVTIGPISGARTSGFPQLVVSGRRVVAAWTHVQRGAPTRISIATAMLSR